MPAETRVLLDQARQAVQAPGDEYHFLELVTALDPADPARYVPEFQAREKVLDIGCGAGQTLIAACAYRVPGEGGLCVTCSRTDCPTWGYGVDIDASALRLGKAWSRRMILRHAPAERLPFNSQEFDVVISRVALVFVDMRRALTEIRRVLRPGGRVWFTLHRFGFINRQFREASWRRRLFLAYITLNGLLFHTTLHTFSIWGRREYWQTASAMKRALAKYGFREVHIENTETTLIVSARL